MDVEGFQEIQYESVFRTISKDFNRHCFKGLPGDPGFDGLRGRPGTSDKGQAGNDGETGVIGAVGLTGPQGTVGRVGVKGYRGEDIVRSLNRIVLHLNDFILFI